MNNIRQHGFGPRFSRIRISDFSLLAGTFLVLFLALLATPASAANNLTWSTNQNRVSADVKSGELLTVLEQIAGATGWRVFVERGAAATTVSARFKDLRPGEALHLLLGDLNFALVPETNASPKLFVFRTSMRNATQLIKPAKPAGVAAAGKLIPNELIVRLKPGTKIEEIARLLGAKVTGRIESLNAYRLQFEDAASADAARAQLASNSEVASVDSNYSFDPPTSPREVPAGSAAPGIPHLQMKAPPDTGRIIVGLLDTAVQTLGNGLDSFMLQQISIAGDAQLDPSSPSHGTSMAETILGSLQDVTKGSTSVQILPVDVYGPNASTTTFDVANGIVAAVNKGANIINLSLGSDSDSPFLHGVIQDATSDKKILVIGAAGNTPVTTPFLPGAYSEVLGVTAVDKDGTIASYANRNPSIPLGAPGTSVVYLNGKAFYVVGTSVSSAYVSGVAAGYRDATGGTTPQTQSFLLDKLGKKTTSAK